MRDSSGKAFWKALEKEKPLQIVGTVNAYTAKMAEKIGFEALYLSGAGVANASYGLPDIGVTTLDNVLEDARRIISAVNIPLLVDIDTGWGGMLKRGIRELDQAGVAAIHIEDQEFSTKRCGHLPGKVIVSTEEMLERIQTAAAAKIDPHFVIIARTDAFASEGIDGTIARAIAYRDAGAEMIFPDALDQLEHYTMLKKATGIPIIANITEFGKTPLFTLQELREAEVDIALYPLSANRAMNRAALKVFETIRHQGTQKEVISMMQTREELDDFLNDGR